MRRSLLACTFAVALLALLTFSAPPAMAQDVDEIVGQVELRGYYVEPGASGDVNELEALSGVDPLVGIVILASEADGGDDLLATAVVERVSNVDTVLVISDVGIGSRSVVYESAELSDATEAALQSGRNGDSNAAIAAAFVQGLPAAVPATADPGLDASGDDAVPANAAVDNGGGGFSIWWIVIPLVLVGLVVWFFVLRRRNTERDLGDVEAARHEIREQLDAIANEILENQDRIELSNNEAAIAHYREANATYASALEELDATENLLALAELNDRVDRARWQLDAAEALVEGRSVPPEPEPEKPVACFFDPTHKPGSAEAVVRTAAGNKDVKVCPRCADQLRRGERPTPREIPVRGRRVPAAKAPRSHGGRGMGGLDVFDIVLGGLGGVLAGRSGGGGGGRDQDRGVSHDWGNPLGGRRGRRNTGVFGPDVLPPGPRGPRIGGRRGGGGGRVAKGRSRGRF